MEKKDFRPIMLFHFKLGINASECLSQIEKAFPDCAPSLSTVSRWYFRFQTGDENLGDDPRTGRPVTVMTLENVKLVKKLVEMDPRMTYEMMEEETGLTAPILYSILHDHLKMSKVCSRWIPHFLNEDQKKARVKFCHDMLKRFESGQSADVLRIVTGDETWVYCYTSLSGSNRTCNGSRKDRPVQQKSKSKGVLGRLWRLLSSTKKG